MIRDDYTDFIENNRTVQCWFDAKGSARLVVAPESYAIFARAAAKITGLNPLDQIEADLYSCYALPPNWDAI